MARELSSKDIEILKKLAPECAGLECAGSRAPYKSILPPLSNHFATDAEDFTKRIAVLDDEELLYLLSLIKSGEESLGCVQPHSMEIFLNFIEERLDTKTAEEIMGIYMAGQECSTDDLITFK
ncbi:hypothetical protein HWN40_06180 [Methanolobus zinderi]|uniref:Uncharacterized protein n=1 Tax=Methanolobus zinderi TaxID=536044 RepID=A0A7D5I4V4_9EURY|nr:hypothetical protein [Methanolobus zinderi]KXS41782.1 MAG: hypothetical protein AWU59_1933 [Methanolobus sp. T82-4]QLC49863.1 hypothetical protein HWN40_06180 [Methanolobus zinderi]